MSQHQPDGDDPRCHIYFKVLRNFARFVCSATLSDVGTRILRSATVGHVPVGNIPSQKRE